MHFKTLTNGYNPHFEFFLISFSVCLCHLLEEAKNFNLQTEQQFMSEGISESQSVLGVLIVPSEKVLSLGKENLKVKTIPKSST